MWIRNGRSLAIVAVVGWVLLAAVPASSQPVAARLAGTFDLTGRVTAAFHVAGETRGQKVSRTWTFTPRCAAGPCAKVMLARQRARGTDTLKLHQTTPGSYTGTGSFYAPLQCANRIYNRGEHVPFTITVRITATTSSAGGVYATAISATYTNRQRINLTPCVMPPSHDAATYKGTLSSGAPA